MHFTEWSLCNTQHNWRHCSVTVVHCTARRSIPLLATWTCGNLVFVTGTTAIWSAMCIYYHWNTCFLCTATCYPFSFDAQVPWYNCLTANTLCMTLAHIVDFVLYCINVACCRVQHWDWCPKVNIPTAKGYFNFSTYMVLCTCVNCYTGCGAVFV